MKVIKDTAGTIIDKLDSEFMKLQMTHETQLAYKNGQEYFHIHATESGYQYKVYSMDYLPLRFGSVDDATIPIDKAAERGMAKAGFSSDFATPFNTKALIERITQAEMATMMKTELTPETAIAERQHITLHR